MALLSLLTSVVLLIVCITVLIRIDRLQSRITTVETVAFNKRFQRNLTRIRHRTVLLSLIGIVNYLDHDNRRAGEVKELIKLMELNKNDTEPT